MAFNLNIYVKIKSCFHILGTENPWQLYTKSLVFRFALAIQLGQPSSNAVKSFY